MEQSLDFASKTNLPHQFLYSYYGEDSENKTLYIGRSIKPFYRMLQHRKNSLWFNECKSLLITPLSNITECKANEIEKNAIKTFTPKYNKVHNEANYVKPAYISADEVFVYQYRFGLYKYDYERWIGADINKKGGASVNYLYKLNLTKLDCLLYLRWMPPQPNPDWSRRPLK